MFASASAGVAVMYDVSIMKRTTVMLPDDVSDYLRYEAKQRGVSVAALVREAVEARMPGPERRELSFVGVGDGEVDGSVRVDEHVAKAVRRRHAAR